MKVTKQTIAFVAGVLDARGHIRVESRRGRPEPRIRVTTRRAELLTYLASLTGTRLHVDDAGYERRPCSAHCRDAHQHAVRQSAYFNIDATRAFIVLFNVRPFIVCQLNEVRAALEVGWGNYPPPKSATVAQMERLGWPIPETP